MTMELVRSQPVQRRCALYRHFDVYETLLYVGITDSLGDRTNSGHARTSEWVQFAMRAEAEWYDSRDEASAAEQEAVESERPVFNRQYAQGDVDRQILDYLHEREVRELRATVDQYRAATARLFAAVADDDYLEAEKRATDDYHCAGLEPMDLAFNASILRHLAHLFQNRKTDIQDGATAEAMKAVIEFAGRQLEEIRDRRTAATEPPF
jgi:hypothetical protein